MQLARSFTGIRLRVTVRHGAPDVAGMIYRAVVQTRDLPCSRLVRDGFYPVPRSSFDQAASSPRGVAKRPPSLRPRQAGSQ